MHFCGVHHEQFAVGEVVRKMPTNRPTYVLEADLPGVTRQQLSEWCAFAFSFWAEACDLEFREVASRTQANFRITHHQFGDGPFGVLADCQLPYGGQQLMRLDIATKWVASVNPPQGAIDIVAVLAHEMGHGIGLSHFPTGGPPDLMEPSYRAGLRKPQSAEREYVRKLYGEPKVSQPVPTPVAPLGDSLGVDLVIGKMTEEFAEIERFAFVSGGRKYLATGKANRVQPNKFMAGGLE